jgi:hypothetical protein
MIYKLSIPFVDAKTGKFFDCAGVDLLLFPHFFEIVAKVEFCGNDYKKVLRKVYRPDQLLIEHGMFLRLSCVGIYETI